MLQIDIGPEKAARLLKQLQQDANFLCVHRLMDYSLLIGIYYANKNAGKA